MRRLLREHSAEPADGGAQWFTDDDIELLVGHGVTFRWRGRLPPTLAPGD